MRISDWSSDVCSSDLNLRHWRITGIPQAVCDLYSKRADEIDAYLAEAGHTSYRARSVAARDTRSVKRHTGADELLPHWQTELHELGWSVERLATALDTDRTTTDRKSTRLNSSHSCAARMPSSG